MQTTPTLIEEQWPTISRLLPQDLDLSAREHGAMKRKRGAIDSAEQLPPVLSLPKGFECF
jgi:hypothetical protein